MHYIITAIKPHSKPIQITVTSPALKRRWIALYTKNHYRTHVSVTKA